MEAQTFTRMSLISIQQIFMGVELNCKWYVLFRGLILKVHSFVDFYD